MRKVFTALIFSLFAFAVQAQQVLCPGTGTPVPIADAAGFTCVPAPFGAGTQPTFRTNASGTVVYWYCPNADQTWNLQFAVASYAWLQTAQPASDLSVLIGSTNDALTAFNALFAKNKSASIADLTALWCPYSAEMLAGAPKPPVSFVVAKNGTTTTRPVYTLVAGVLKATTLRAPVGAVCSNITVINSISYGTYAGAPSPQDVAICAKTP